MNRAPGQKAFLLTSFGCQMNLADAQRIRGILQNLGYAEVEKEVEADLIIFNTCCVRQHAEDRFASRVQALRGLKKHNPRLLIAVGGCIAQKEQEKIFDALPVIDLAFGTNDIERLPELLERLKPGEHRIGPFAGTGVFDGEQADGVVLDRPCMAFVNIIRGCTNFCAYCIVPTVRGPEVSRPLPEIVDFVQNLVAKGVREITLLGQNVNAYGKDLGMEEGFATLVE
ncbi:MAG TPA: radical SAM protein, partial [Candidatus Ozemobacteraceae bacterium]|nr:radical SAM protein [Candidatus Ozemobacteraceae bacterium]